MIEFISRHLAGLEFAALFGGMLLLAPIEAWKPCRAPATLRLARWPANIGLALLNHFLLVAVGAALSISLLIPWLQPRTPLLARLDLSPAVEVLATLLALEFVNYWFHRVLHRVPLLWRIHAVHHLDTAMDVTTSHRHHPFEGLLNVAVTLPLTLWFGAPPGALLLYVFLHIGVALFSHSNIALPRRLDAVLRLFLVTPDFHRPHHASERRYCDSNYGMITPWFDYLFGTASHLPFARQRDIELGIRNHRETVHLDQLLVLPFQYQDPR